MATFTVKVDIDNDAFQPRWQDECAEILERLAAKMYMADEDFRFSVTLYDRNGNDVGRAKLVKGPREP